MGLIGTPRVYSDRLAFLEANLAINTLRDQIDAGWSVLQMVDGVADEFEDTAGIGSNDGTYDSTGDYIHNPGAATTSYANSGGTGNRTGSITVTKTGVFNVPTTSELVDGTTTAQSADWGTNADPTGSTVTFDFGTAKVIDEVKIYSQGGGGWGAYKYRGSNDGSNWTDVSSNFTAPYASITTALTGTQSGYRYYQIYGVSGATGNQYTLHEFEFKIATPVSPGNITVVSTASTAQAAPSEARIVLLHQPVNSVTINTDVTLEVSRDGGTTWTAGTLVNDGAFDGSTNILTATIDVSGQPAGTAMKWRYKTFNAKEQRLHGVWMQWR